MPININEKIYDYIEQGFSQGHARSRVTQDIILHKISCCELKNNITIKGGVVMFNLTKMIRRATMDIDIDFIRYSIDDTNIEAFFNALNKTDSDVLLEIQYPIKELKQLDYKGKRIIFLIKDTFGNVLKNAKIDLGVHKNISIEQDEFTFYIESLEQGVVLQVNSKEQIFAEKLTSLLRHGLRSTRYKDIYDLFYLITQTTLRIENVLPILEVIQNIEKYHNQDDVYKMISRILNNPVFARNASTPHNDWLDVEYSIVVKTILEFLSAPIIL